MTPVFGSVVASASFRPAANTAIVGMSPCVRDVACTRAMSARCSEAVAQGVVVGEARRGPGAAFAYSLACEAGQAVCEKFDLAGAGRSGDDALCPGHGPALARAAPVLHSAVAVGAGAGSCGLAAGALDPAAACGMRRMRRRGRRTARTGRARAEALRPPPLDGTGDRGPQVSPVLPVAVCDPPFVS